MSNESLSSTHEQAQRNVVIVVAIYIGLGTCAFFVFQEKTKYNILVNFLPQEIPATIAKFGLCIQLTIV